MPLTLEVAAVMLLATIIRSAFGFGEALVAVPLLALLIPVELAAPVAVFASVLVAGAVLAQDWRHADFRSAGRLVVSTLFGIPLGLFALKTVPEPAVKAALGAIVVAYALYALANRKPRVLRDDRWVWPFGFFAGVFGGAYGLNGPPLAVYGSLRGWSPARFRATLQGYFLPASLVGAIGYAVAGLWTPTALRLSAASIPSIVIGVPLGRSLSRRLAPGTFLRVLNGFLAVVGLILFLEGIRGGV